VAEVDEITTVIPCEVTLLERSCTSKGVLYEELTLTELTSNPLTKVNALGDLRVEEMKGMKATISFPEKQADKEAVST
jgi:hypothetical protein